jgi:dihydroflavonol-4-reductase
MRVAVTGASGHLGGALVRMLVDAGATVRVLVHDDRRALDGVRVDVHEGDLREPEVVPRLVSGCERVFHLAALISLEPKDEALMMSTNVDGVRTVVAACRDAGVTRMVHVSSIHAFSALPVDAPVDETRGPAEPQAPRTIEARPRARR